MAQNAQKLGNDRNTGELLEGIDHLRQSITDILFTPLGSCVMRRDYGSLLFSLLDSPATGNNLIKVFAASAHAIATWEPRFKLTRILNISSKENSKNGKFSLDLEGDYLGNKVRFEVLN